MNDDPCAFYAATTSTMHNYDMHFQAKINFFESQITFPRKSTFIRVFTICCQLILKYFNILFIKVSKTCGFIKKCKLKEFADIFNIKVFTWEKYLHYMIPATSNSTLLSRRY